MARDTSATCERTSLPPSPRVGDHRPHERRYDQGNSPRECGKLKRWQPRSRHSRLSVRLSLMPDRFTVRLRAHAAAHLDFDETLKLTWPDGEALLQSEYTGGTDGKAYAVTLHGEMRGLAESLDDAHRKFANVLLNLFNIVGLCANAAVADPRMIAAYGIDLTTPQPFVGYRTPDAREWFPPGKRRIDLEATVAALDGFETKLNTPFGGYLLRSVAFYNRALRHWIPEERLMAGEFLFIAAETLSRFILEGRAAARGITPKNEAQREGLEGPDALRHRILDKDIFASDEEALVAMQNASDGFEHGFMALEGVQGLIEPVLERSMGHVRQALIDALDVAPPMRDRLLADEYTQPSGLVPDRWFVVGELSRQDPSQPPPEMDPAAVELAWKAAPLEATRTEDGELTITFPLTNISVERKPPNTIVDLRHVVLRAGPNFKQTETAPDAKVVSPGEPDDDSSTSAGGSDPVEDRGTPEAPSP